MTPLVKGAIAAGALASIGGASYAGVHYLSPNLEISKLIDEEYKHLLLNTETDVDNAHWKTNWGKYKSNKGNVFNLAGWKDDDSALNLTDALKKKCSELKASYVYGKDDDLYKNVTIYCSRWVSIEDEAKKDKLNLITESTTNGDWTKVAAKKDALRNDFTSLGIKLDTDSTYKAEEVKRGCTDATKKNKGESKYDEIYNSYKKVCVKEAAS